MEKINIQIAGDTSGESVNLFKRVYDNFLSRENIKSAEVHYIKSKGLCERDSDPRDWPLQIFTESGVMVSVYNVTAGYNGSGPYDMKKILDMCGFRVTEKVLYSLRDEVKINFTHPNY